MNRPLTGLMLLILATASPAQDEINFPNVVPPVPPPPPSSGVVLAEGVYYVVTSTKPFFVLTSPDGILTVTAETGPLRLRGRFVDNPSKVQTKTFKDAHIAIIEVAAAGKVELFVFPSGVTDVKQIIRKIIDAQVGPQPPPPQPIPPTPPPTPTDPLTAALQVAYTADAAADKAKSLGLLQSAYKAMAGSVPATLKSNIDVFNWMKSVVEAPNLGLGTDKLRGVRQAISVELTTTFGTMPTTPVDAGKVSSELSKVASALGGIK